MSDYMKKFLGIVTSSVIVVMVLCIIYPKAMEKDGTKAKSIVGSIDIAELSKEIKETSNKLVKEVKEEINPKSLGVFKITVYDSCEKCSGSWGTQLARPCDGSHSAIANHTVAVDPEVIPYGTVLIIDGQEYVAEDCGGAVKGNVIDVYVEDCSNSFGLKYSEVFIK